MDQLQFGGDGHGGFQTCRTRDETSSDRIAHIEHAKIIARDKGKAGGIAQPVMRDVGVALRQRGSYGLLGKLGRQDVGAGVAEGHGVRDRSSVSLKATTR